MSPSTEMPPRQCQTRAQPFAATSKFNPEGTELGCCHLSVQESSPPAQNSLSHPSQSCHHLKVCPCHLLSPLPAVPPPTPPSHLQAGICSQFGSQALPCSCSLKTNQSQLVSAFLALGTGEEASGGGLGAWGAGRECQCHLTVTWWLCHVPFLLPRPLCSRVEEKLGSKHGRVGLNAGK